MKKFSRIVIVLLIAIMLIPIFNNKYEIKNGQDAIVNSTVNTSIKNSHIEELKNKCKSYYLVEPISNTVIAKHNENARYQIASMTKIMTSIIVFDSINNGKIGYDTLVNISKNASSIEGSKILLDYNSNHSVDNLLKSVIVSSANDSATALAEHIAGNTEQFVVLMNERAKQLKLENTKFCNVTGLPNENQYSSAKDVAIMLNELMKNKKYFEYCKILLDDYVHPSGRKTTMTNTNKLIKYYNGCDSGKTGYTDVAKHCLCASAVRNNTRFISSVIGANTSKERFYTVSELLNFAFNNYTNKIIYNKNQQVTSFDIKGAKGNKIPIFAKDNIVVFSKNNEKPNYKISIEKEEIKAPIKKDSVVAKVVIEINNTKNSFDLIVKEDVLQKDYIDSLTDIFINW